MINNNENWMTETQAAKLIGVTRANISYHVRKGNLRYKRVSNRVLVNRREVELLAKYTKSRGVKRSGGLKNGVAGGLQKIRNG